MAWADWIPSPKEAQEQLIPSKTDILLTLVFTGILVTPLFFPAPTPLGPPIAEELDGVREGVSPKDSGNLSVALTRKPNATIRADFETNNFSQNFGISTGRGSSWNRSSGFTSTWNGGLAWDNQNQSPWAEYSYTTESVTKSGVMFNHVRYFDRSGWAFTPGIEVDGASTEVTFNQSGFAVAQYAYFGPYKEYTSEIDGNKIRFFAGKGSGFRHTSTETAINATDSYLRFSRPQKETPVVVLPGKASAYNGVTVSTNRRSGAIIILDKQSMGRFNLTQRWNAPVTAAHEYVHTHQTHWRLAGNLRWLREASAVYYSVEPMYRAGDLSEEAYNAIWARKKLNLKSDAALSNKSTWRKKTPYTRGAFVLAGLDARIREKTNESASLQTVLQEADLHKFTALQDLTSTVRRVAGNETADWFVDVTTTSKLPQEANQVQGSFFNVFVLHYYVHATRGGILAQSLVFLFTGFGLQATTKEIVSKVRRTLGGSS